MPPAEPDRRGELIYLATQLDAALVADEVPNVAQWFADGQLTVAEERVRAAVDRIVDAGATAHATAYATAHAGSHAGSH